MSRGDKTKLLWQNPVYREHMSRVHKENGLIPPSRKGCGPNSGSFKKGHKTWIKGKTHSEKTKNILSEKFKGRTAWNKGMGDKTNYYKKLRNSIEYKSWRKEVFERDNYRCQLCEIRSGDGNGKTVYLHPHHIKCIKNSSELVYDVDNGVTLCKKCHFKLHKKFGLKDYPIMIKLDNIKYAETL